MSPPVWTALLLLIQGASALSTGVSWSRWTPQEASASHQYRRVMRTSVHPAVWGAIGLGLNLLAALTLSLWPLVPAAALGLICAWKADRDVTRHLGWEAKRRKVELDHWRNRGPAEQLQIRRAALQRQELAHIQGQALRHLMDPHFLFNALNGVMQRFLKGSTPDALGHLAAFRRLAVRQNQAGRDGWWSLEEEWRVLEDYVALELDRIGRPVDVTQHPLPPALSAASIPALMVQPLVENALWHGLGGNATHSENSGTLSIEARRESNHKVRIEVRNSRDGDAPAMPFDPKDKPKAPTRRRHAGELIRHRLRLLGAEKEGQFTLEHFPTESRATLLLPVRETVLRTSPP